MTCLSTIRRVLQWMFWTISIALVVLLFASWVISIYVDGVEGLLTPHGIRWMCSSIVSNFTSVPLAQIILGLMALSVLRESGIFLTLRGHVSLKQKRALQITGVFVLIILCLFSLLLLLPNAVLLSAFGTYSHSAFSKGMYGLMACLAIFVGNVYGYTSGKLVSTLDFLRAHTAIFSTVANCFIFLFLASQFVGCLHFTGILTLLGDSDGIGLFVLKILLYGVPLLLYVVLAFLQNAFNPHFSHSGR